MKGTAMQNTIYIKPVNVYGQTMYKPVNDIAHIFAQLTGKQNLTTKELVKIELLGYVVTEVNQYNSIKVIG